LGIDTFSSDTGENGFPVHRAILGADKYLVENVANAELLPATGAKVLVLPPKIKDATEAPLRLIALI
jgi:kynurenine formamidase